MPMATSLSCPRVTLGANHVSGVPESGWSPSALVSPVRSSLADHQHDERAWHVPAAGAFGRWPGGGGRVGSGGREVEAMRPGVQRDRLGTHLGRDGLYDLELVRSCFADHGNRAVAAVGA